ncbi:hypothetical protein DEO72_LG1g3034 [Vigna unguiculata]|uniref:Secreted protein n=1 Tax=Vigna unguiculata TaxID=3917 RepID=A0A4D6KZ99_VIGUN|nr:hypothetical protein DEO72_LG1g3034 [Vigna unguiculata]
MLGFRVQTDQSFARPRSTHLLSSLLKLLDLLSLVSESFANPFSVVVAWRTMARPVTLAQARLTRLGETCRSKKCSLKRERVGALVCCCCLSPSEEPHLWARGGLTQARRARLSEHSQNFLGASVASLLKREFVA